jgi:hypothetical protein
MENDAKKINVFVDTRFTDFSQTVTIRFEFVEENKRKMRLYVYSGVIVGNVLG